MGSLIAGIDPFYLNKNFMDLKDLIERMSTCLHKPRG